jgi:hypothetical protein
LTSGGNVEALRPEPEQEDDNEQPNVEEVQPEETEEEGGEARSSKNKGEEGKDKGLLWSPFQ